MFHTLNRLECYTQSEPLRPQRNLFKGKDSSSFVEGLFSELVNLPVDIVKNAAAQVGNTEFKPRESKKADKPVEKEKTDEPHMLFVAETKPKVALSEDKRSENHLSNVGREESGADMAVLPTGNVSSNWGGQQQSAPNIAPVDNGKNPLKVQIFNNRPAVYEKQ